MLFKPRLLTLKQNITTKVATLLEIYKNMKNFRDTSELLTSTAETGIDIEIYLLELKPGRCKCLYKHRNQDLFHLKRPPENSVWANLF